MGPHARPFKTFAVDPPSPRAWGTGGPGVVKKVHPTTIVLVAGGGFVAYQLWKASSNANKTLNKLNPLLDKANKGADQVNGVLSDFSSVSNAIGAVAKGLGGLFGASGSGPSSTLGRAPSSTTGIGGKSSGNIEDTDSFFNFDFNFGGGKATSFDLSDGAFDLGKTTVGANGTTNDFWGGL